MKCWKHISRRYEMPNLLLLTKGDYPLHRVPLYMKYLLEKNLKKRTVHSILLDVEEALSKKYLSGHFYNEIKSVLAENFLWK